MPFKYEPGKEGLLATSTRISYTVVPIVMGHAEFWLFLAFHLAVSLAYRNDYLEGAHLIGNPLHIRWAFVMVISSMTTFFEVFYTNECYSRYQLLFNHTRDMLNSMHTFIFELRVHFQEGCHRYTRLSSRFLMASMLLFFFELGETISEDNDEHRGDLEERAFLATEKQWGELLAQGLVMPEEKTFLDHFSKQEKHLIMLMWSGEIAKMGHTECKAPANVVKGSIDNLVGIAKTQQHLVDSLSLPVPFQYYHLLNLMVTVNLIAWGYAMGCTKSAFAPMVYLFAELIFMGMLELASQLSNPFGSDEVDFPVAEWVGESISTGAILVEHDYLHSKESWELKLAQERRLHVAMHRFSIFGGEASASASARSPRLG
mmetsp:Transcript_46803/g.106148  ORF Transcript_46803/g.106148 Transcript_46803/m.106148 type:complete len:373 (-) Transcript_46803:36-1154(-)